MEFPVFIKSTLEEIGAVDANEPVAGEDSDKVAQAFDIVAADLRARDIVQIVLNSEDTSDVPDSLAPSLIVLVGYQVAPAYGFPRDERARLYAENRLIEITRSPYYSTTLKKCSFL